MSASKPLPEVTPANYYDLETMEYLSNSGRGDWMDCPNRRWNWEIKRDPQAAPVPVAAYATGAMLDALVLDRSDLERVLEEHAPFLFEPNGRTPNKDNLRTQFVAKWMLRQPWIRRLIDSSQRQVIRTFTIAGVPYKARYDLLHEESQMIWDLKHLADLITYVYSDKWQKRVHWAVAYDYLSQLCVYQEAERQYRGGDPEFLATGPRYSVGLLGVSKPPPVPKTKEIWRTPDVSTIYWGDYGEESNMHQITDRYDAIECQTILIKGWRKVKDPDAGRGSKYEDEADQALRRCEACEYCRNTRGESYDWFTEYPEKERAWAL